MRQAYYDFGLGIHRGHERHMRIGIFRHSMTADTWVACPCRTHQNQELQSADMISRAGGRRGNSGQNNPSPSCTPHSMQHRRAADKFDRSLPTEASVTAATRSARHGPWPKTIRVIGCGHAVQRLSRFHRKVAPQYCRRMGRPFGNAAWQRLEIGPSADRGATFSPVRQSVITTGTRDRQIAVAPRRS